MEIGYLYIISHEMFGADNYKLGYSHDNDKVLKSRYHTYYITPPKIEATYLVCDKKIGERLLFYKLKKYRINDKKEFFNCKIEILKQKCEETAKVINDECNMDEIHKIINGNILQTVTRKDLNLHKNKSNFDELDDEDELSVVNELDGQDELDDENEDESNEVNELNEEDDSDGEDKLNVNASDDSDGIDDMNDTDTDTDNVYQVDEVKNPDEKADSDHLSIAHIRTTEEIDHRLSLYLDCVSDLRLHFDKELIIIGLIIYNEKGSCDLYDKVAKRSSSYDNTCYIKWKTFHDPTVNDKRAKFSTLIKIAKEDSRQKFRETLLKDKQEIIDEILNRGITDFRCACLFYSMLPDAYIYDELNNNLYTLDIYGIHRPAKGTNSVDYHFNTTILIEIENVYEKKMKISKLDEDNNNLTRIYDNTCKYMLSISTNHKLIAELKMLYEQDKIYKHQDNINKYMYTR